MNETPVGPSQAPWFEALLEATPAALLVLDDHGHIAHLNAHAETLFGRPRARMLGKSFETLLSDRFVGTFGRHMREGIETPRPPGAVINLEVFARQGESAEGAEFPIVVGLTQLGPSEARLHLAFVRPSLVSDKLEARFRRLLEAAPDALVLTDRHGKIMQVNQQAERLFGYQRGELLQKKIDSLIPERCRTVDSPSDDRDVAGIQNPFGGSSLPEIGLRKDGREFPTEISLSPLDQTGDGDHEDDWPIAIATIRDVTDQKRTETQRSKLAQAQEAIRLRDEFLSVVSHELRTPLTPIQLQIDGALRAARRNDENMLETVVRKLEALGSGIHRLSTLVNQLLDLSRITAGKLELERTVVDLVSVARRSVVAFEDEAVHEGCLVEFEAPRPELRGRWDGSRLEQVMVNLLSNALRYGSGKPVWITVVEVRPGWATVLVRDQGVGIAAEHQPLVFQRFERLNQTRHRGSFGLGLWIVRQIVDAHNGTIKLFSRPGVGSTFGVDLPTGDEAPSPVPKNLVLLIHGDPRAREAFRQAARTNACRGITAISVADALALVHFGVEPRLVLFDAALETGDEAGSEAGAALSAFQRSTALQSVPVLARAGDAMSAAELRLLLERSCPDLAAPVAAVS